MAEICASSDVFVFPSTTDTLGLVVLEARAAGLPVVVPGTENGVELLAGSRFGDVFNPDREGDMERAVAGVLSAKVSRLAVSREARARYQGWRQCTQDLVGGYRLAISSRLRAENAVANLTAAAL